MKRINIIILSLALLIASGCEDFLENPPLGQLSDANFPESEEDAILATNGVYNILRTWHFHAGGFPILDIMSDDARKGSAPGDQLPTIGAYDDFSFDASESSLDRWWKTLYQGIKRSYMVLENLPSIEMDAGLKNRLEAEARFLNAYFYFTLVRAYGDVPMVTSSSAPRKLDQTSEDVIYEDVIIPNLELAIQDLPERSEYSPNDYGRATKGAAKGILAKVYLFRQDFTNAEKYALEVINSGEYSLDPDFGHAFSVDGEHGPGSVFEIGAVPENTSAGGNQYANTWGVRGTPNLGWGFGRPTLDLINFYDDEDPRMDATVIFLGEVLEGIEIIGDVNTPDSTYKDEAESELLEIETYNQKTFVPGTQARISFGHNRRLLRYADVLLMAAEALNENGKSGEALDYLNMVRERARGGNPDILPDINTTDQNELRDIIIAERRRELALEGHRFWDLVRTGKASEVLGPLGFQEGKHELLPIPQSEIDISEGAITQNPGW